MAPHIEANSLSDLTYLAGNPPKYPRNPTEEKRKSLTFYIARVPGSRDIILTTLKPQLKNVTAEDVASSLYYLHLNTEDDTKYFAEGHDAIPEEADPSTPVEKLLPRKPLPESARSSLDIGHSISAISTDSELVSAPPTKRKPVAGTNIPSSIETPVQVKQSVPRRPLGPRPLLPEGSKPVAGIENQPPNAALQPQYCTYSPSRNSNNLDDESSSAEKHPSKPFLITLIRRDPASGAQWNIGTVTGHSVRDEGQPQQTKPTSRSRRPYFDISIHFTTSGYNYFRNSHLTQHISDCTTGLGSSLPMHNNTRGVANASNSAAPSSGFHREVRMEGSGFWGRSAAQHRRNKSDTSGKQSATRSRSSSESHAINGPEALHNSHSAGINSNESQAKGYIFLSPWGGRCKFSTSSSGRSLRCKHTLPPPISASSTTESQSSPQASASVSELRFNLPSSAMFTAVATAVTKKGGAEPAGFSIPKFGHIRNKLSPQKMNPPLPPRPHPNSLATMYPSDDEEPPALPPRPYVTSCATESSEDETHNNSRRSYSPLYTVTPRAEEVYDNYEAPLDLSLGQEKAGGGNRGKRAKLGKLIIHDEGFKMLDLVVAANMGIWWSVWESDFR